MSRIPQPGQRTIPVSDWRRFLRLADWFDRVHGHRPPSPDAAEYGNDLIVLTPSGGIAARSGNTIYSATCQVMIECESGTAGQKTLVLTPDEIIVYNIYPDAVTGGVYVPTGLLMSGTRYVTGEPCLATEDDPYA